MIHISSRQQGGASIVQVSGRMDAVTAPEFEQACLEIVGAGAKVLVVDFGGLEYMSSAGIRSLLVIGKTLQESGGALRLANATGLVGQVFALSGFYSLFPCFESVERAAG